MTVFIFSPTCDIVCLINMIYVSNVYEKIKIVSISERISKVYIETRVVSINRYVAIVQGFIITHTSNVLHLYIPLPVVARIVSALQAVSFRL